MAAHEDYSWLRAQCEFRMRVADSRYAGRELIPPGDWLYDPQIRWADEDGSIVLADIGGQPQRGWDPNAGYGAIYRLKDDKLHAIVPRGCHGMTAPLRPEKAPPHFGRWGGHIFTIAQAKGGRAGAHQQHFVYRIDPADGIPHEFARLPNSGTIGNGIPAAGMTHQFGRKGTPHEGYLYVSSLGNCTLYRVTPDGEAKPYLVFDEKLVGRPMMPFLGFHAPDHSQWKRYAGDYIVMTRATSYFEAHKPEMTFDYWRIDPAGPGVEKIDGITWRPGPIAPPEFGPYAGHMFTVDEGTTNLLHTTANLVNAKPLPYDGRIMRIAPDGSEHVFADQLQGSSTALAFNRDRLFISFVRKSYSTGEYHEPDGSIYDIRWTGKA
jgi:hypothetical protein